MFFLYQILIIILLIFSPLIIFFRIFKKKEDKKRFKEKFCFPSKKRVRGNLIWLHGSSVGELLSILPLVKELEKNKSINQILISGTNIDFEELHILKPGISWSKNSDQIILASASRGKDVLYIICLLYTSPSPRDRQKSRMPSSA